MNITPKGVEQRKDLLEDVFDMIALFLDFLPLPGKALILKGILKIIQLIQDEGEFSLLKEQELLEILNAFDEDPEVEASKLAELIELRDEKIRELETTIEELEDTLRSSSDIDLAVLSLVQDLVDGRNDYLDVLNNKKKTPYGISLADYFELIFYVHMDYSSVEDRIVIIDNR